MARTALPFLRRRAGMSAGLVCAAISLLSPARAPAEDRPAPTEAEVRAAIGRGAEYLLSTQNADGSWGGALNAVYTFTGDVWSNPETHRSWKVATTALGVMAMLDLSERADCLQAASRGVGYVCSNIDVKRPNEWDTMNSWAYIYGLHALAAAMGNERIMAEAGDQVRTGAAFLLDRLKKYQSISGGWGYLELNPPRTIETTWGTSFVTASAVLAMVEAQQRGLSVDALMRSRAIKAIRHCRLPSGAYTYSINPFTMPGRSEWIDQIKGSLGRIQTCNSALLAAGEQVPVEELRKGVAEFFQFHRFLDIARYRPIPHEAYYYNSGYFYLYGHYHCAKVISRLPEEDRGRWWAKLQREVMKGQQADGSVWDYDMHSYHKPYGTAFAVMALVESLKGAGQAGR